MNGHIRPRGKASWEIKFDAGTDPVTGKRITRYVSVKGTRKDAHRRLVELLKTRDDGSYVEPSKLTVAEHVRARVKQWEANGDIGAKTAERYLEMTERQIVPYIGAKLIQKLKPADIEAWHSTLKAKGRKDGTAGLAPKTVVHCHAVLRKALNDALRNDLVSKNAAISQQPPRGKSREVTILTDETMKTLLERLEGRAMRAPVLTALYTGLRRGELLALRWANVDLDRRVLAVKEALSETATEIQVKTPKAKTGFRDVTLPGVAIDILRKHRQTQLEQRMAAGLGRPPADALVFPRPDGSHQSPHDFSSAWGVVARSIGLPDVTFHALRHTHVSQLIDAGVDIVVISRRLGHASPNITLGIYAHMFRKTDDKAAAAIDAALAKT
jgi:integrase